MRIEYAADTITTEDVIKHLGLTGGAAGVLAEIAARREAVKEAKAAGLSVDEAKLQEFADSFRVARGLHAAEDMLAFLDRSGLTVEDFEAYCESSLLVDTLKDHWATEQAVREHFLAHRGAFDRARVSVLVAGTEGLALEIGIRTTDEGEDFHTLAREHSIDPATRYAGGFVGLVGRDAFAPETAAKVFNASPGDLVGPIEQDGAFHLILVEEIVRAELNDDVKALIRERIFAQWAAKLLREGFRVRA